MNKIPVKEEILRWAVERSGLSFDQLTDKFPRIREWATGGSQPTLRQLELLAKTTLTPLGFLFLDYPPEERLPIPHFRTVTDEISKRPPSPDILETIQIMQQRQAWMREYSSEQGHESLPFVRLSRVDDPPHTIANRLRALLGIDKNWAAMHTTWTDALDDLRQAIEKIGVMVAVNGIVGNNTHRKLDPNEFRGFVLVDDYAPLVFINGADSRAAQMFTLAHELAHVAFGSSAAFDLRGMLPSQDKTEQACNRVAAEFLVPEKVLRQSWLSVKNAPEPFQEIARQFKVSVLVAARRALDLGLINKTAFLEFYGAYQDNERRLESRRPSGGNFYATQKLRLGFRFGSAVVRAVRKGKLLYSEAFRLTGLHGKTFDHYAAALGMPGE